MILDILTDTSDKEGNAVKTSRSLGNQYYLQGWAAGVSHLSFLINGRPAPQTLSKCKEQAGTWTALWLEKIKIQCRIKRFSKEKNIHVYKLKNYQITVFKVWKQKKIRLYAMDLNASKHEQRESAEFLRNTELYVKSVTNCVVSFLVGKR